jgi:transketolase
VVKYNPNLTTVDIKSLRRTILQASFDAGACHLGSALSCLEIIIPILYEKEGIFLFGKASGVAAYYTILSEQGYFPKEKIAYYLKNYPLPSIEVPGVVHSFGSVGHALSVAVGMALGNREQNVHVLLSDGDCQEGATYEAALFARQHKLDNLFVYVDDNKMVACGPTSEILDLETAYDFLRKTLPNVEIVDTVKGQGVSFMEGDFNWHYKNLTEELLEQALKENE